MQTEDEQQKIQADLEIVIGRMQAIQRAIKASGQPASMLELVELKDLGVKYARLVEQMANTQDDPSRA